MRGLILALLLWPATLWAQTYPDYRSTTVNDFADLLPPAAEARVAGRLAALEAETGVEMTLVTIPDMSVAGPLTLEMYATELFDRWGVGKAERDDGVMLLVFKAERRLRIELGAAYSRNWNGVAQQVMDKAILPPYRSRQEVVALEVGIVKLEADIVRPFLAGNPPPYVDRGPGIGGFIGIVVVGLLALGGGVLGVDRYMLARKPCESCGKTGLSRRKETLVKATRTSSGSGQRTFTCPHCGHVAVVAYMIPMLSDNDSSSFGGGGGSFGGGSSGGGGASGQG